MAWPGNLFLHQKRYMSRLSHSAVALMTFIGVTPSAMAMKFWFAGQGQMQFGSFVDPAVDRVWFRPICGGRWSVVHAYTARSLAVST